MRDESPIGPEPECSRELEMPLLRIAAILGLSWLLAAPALANPAAPAVSAPPPAATRTLQSLVDLPARMVVTGRPRAASPDELIAAAVEAGNDPELEAKDPFRKRSFDLFRTERVVEVGDQDMVLRLRVRPKSRETMSLELHF